MLRVVGGTHRSRKIQEVRSDKTRPTTDRNKETVFNILGQYFSGGKMLDLFSGSGALGIEAISRGMEYVDFVENQKAAQDTIENNLKSLEMSKQAMIHKVDVFDYLIRIENQYDLIIADPPYALNKYQELLDLIVSRHLVLDDGIIVFEADKRTVLPEQSGTYIKYREKISGNTKFAFYGMEESK